MPVSTSTPVTTPTITPATTPTPWRERFTSPDELCPQQHRELGSPDISP
jgi:hypothetical protein